MPSRIELKVKDLCVHRLGCITISYREKFNCFPEEKGLCLLRDLGETEDD